MQPLALEIQKNQTRDALWEPSIADALVQPALASGHDHAFTPQPSEGNRDFLPVAAADAVGYHVDPVAFFQQIEGGLRDLQRVRRLSMLRWGLGASYADVGLYADDDAG